VLVADTLLSGQRVAGELDQIIAERGLPKPFVSTTSYARNNWLIWHQVIVVSRCLDTFRKCLSLAIWSTTVSPITNTEYAFAALTVL